MKTNRKDGVHVTSRGPYIICHSGKHFYPLDVRKSDIKIEDISHALSKQCRFGGHVNKFYSVAEHSVRVSYAIKPQFALMGLLHDGSEAYLVDLPRPIKRIDDFSTYRNIERKTQLIIYKKFTDYPQPSCEVEIDYVDNLLLATEARDLMNNPYWCHSMHKLHDKIEPWGPEKAKRKFMKRYLELHG